VTLQPISQATTTSTAAKPAARAESTQPVDHFEQRSIDGSGNNLLHPEYNKAGTAFIRKAPEAYGDDVSTPSGADRPNARIISNVVLAQTKDKPDIFNWSGMLWGWGQFIDHDMTDTAESKTALNKILVPAGDPSFDPNSTGKAFIPFGPTLPTPGTGAGTQKPMIPWNDNTGWIDGSMIYGSNAARANALRTHLGGELLTGKDNNLPFNTLGLPNDDDVHAPPETLLAAGDVRASENPLLLSLQTVFMREHNRQCAELAQKHPDWNDQQLYDGARKRVGALIESITYQEYLPNLLGPGRMPAYQGYKPDTDPRLALEFTTAGFRLGHSQLGSSIFRNEQDTDMIAQGDVRLKDAYFNPSKTLNEGGIAPVLRGAADYVEQATDTQIVDDVRNFLFGPPGAGGLDLGAINIARGREHGLPDFNSVR
jgi:peroxidase